jgi:molybdate transport system substrate-binding protein
VYAASSLTDVFGDLEVVFENAHPGVDVTIKFAGSHVLRRDIEGGAPADVFASANPQEMDALIGASLVQESRVFAHNDLVIVVPQDNPAGVQSLEDLSEVSRLVLGTGSVPVGRYARGVLRLAAPSHGEGFEAIVMSRMASEASNARQVLVEVEEGAVDAGIVYRTDAGSSERVRVVEIPREFNVVADYVVAVVRRTAARDLADAWVALLSSAEGKAALARHGFSVD